MVLKLLKIKRFQKFYYILSDILVFCRSKLGLLHTFKNSDEISRFAFKKEHLNRKDANNIKMHWKCFKPQKIPSKEISVYWTTGILKKELKEIGQKYVANFANKTLLGRGWFSCQDFNKEFPSKKCCIRHYPYPHKRHANIHGNFDKSGKLLEYIKLESITVYEDLG